LAGRGGDGGGCGVAVSGWHCGLFGRVMEVLSELVRENWH
jgi:hypothetical protein